jgi:hypothetical protein
MGHDWITGVLFAAGALVALVAIVWVWTLLQSAYFWIAEKVTGRDVEGEHLDRLVARERHQSEKDAGFRTDYDRRRVGAAIVSAAVFFLATSVGLIWLCCRGEN